MKRRIIAGAIVTVCLLSSAGCGVVDARPLCADVQVDKTRSFKGVDKEHGNQPVTLRSVTITFDDKIGRAYAYGRDGNSPMGFPTTKDNPLKVMLPEGEYTFYFSGKNAESCKARFHI